jgi:predicted peptidase
MEEYNGKVEIKVEVAYLIYLPEGYDAEKGKKWPLLLFLHGAGERGDDLEKVKAHGPPRLMKEGREFPFIVVAPQCPVDLWWSAFLTKPVLDEVLNGFSVDEDRVYVTGLSMGGYGTWDIAAKYPEMFAAAAPVCGGGEPERAAKMKDLPLWVFHGAKDDVVKLDESEKMVKAVEEAEGDVKFTVYPEAGHDSWTETYDNPELYEWFLNHRRGESD